MGSLRIEGPAHFATAVAEWIAEGLRSAIEERGECSIALAGGTTPRSVYPALANISAVDWTRIAVFFGDERAVPPDDSESNYGMANEMLLSRLHSPPRRVHRMEAERVDLDAATAEYEARLPQALDLLVLGMGSDGHTASLFPLSPALDSPNRVAHVAAPATAAIRMTITPRVITGARSVVVIVAGGGKADVARRVLEGPYTPHELPAQYARDRTWFLDQAAAASMTGR